MSASHVPKPADDSVSAEDSDFQELTRRFLESLARQRTELPTALDEQRWADLSRMAHQLKGTAGGFGFPGVSRSAEALESACRRDPSSASGCLGDLLAAIDRILPE